MRALIALDGSPASEAAARIVGPLISDLGAEVILLTVIDADDVHATYKSTGGPYPVTPRGTISGTPTGVADPLPVVAEDRNQALESARVQATEYLEKVAAEYLGEVIAEPIVEWAGSPAHAIVAAAQEKRADMIVMGTHGRTGIRRMLMGSVAEAVMRLSPIPVLPLREDMRAMPHVAEERARG